MANENTTFNPELVGFKRYKTPAGNYAHNVTYDGNPVGLIGKSAQGFGNPWIGFLFSENGHIAAGSGTDIKAVKSATARAVGLNLAILTGPPKPTPKPEPEVEPNEAEVALGSGAFAPAAAFVGQPAPASAPAPEAKPKPEPKVEADPTYCLCDCGEATGPKSKFRQGHDARVKGKLSRAEKSLEAGFEPKANATALQLPAALVERARTDASFAVAGYGAAKILSLAEKVGTL